MTDTIPTASEQEYKEVTVDEDDAFIKHLQDENKFLRNLVQFLISKTNVEKINPSYTGASKPPLDKTSLIDDPAEARVILETHFNSLAEEEKRKRANE